MARKVSVQFSGFNIPYLGKFKADVGFSSLLATTRIRQLAIYAKPTEEGGGGEGEWGRSDISDLI